MFEKNCKMCHLLSSPCQKQQIEQQCNYTGYKKCRGGKSQNTLRNYTSLLSLNNNHRRKYSYSDVPVDNDSKWASNRETAKTIVVITVHILSIYSMIFLKEITYFSHMFNSFQLILFTYMIFYFLIILFPRLRCERPFNFVTFAIYTILTSMLYSSLLIYLDSIRSIALLILTAQFFLILFCSLQSKFTLISRPILPYLYIYSILAGLLICIFLVLYYCINYPIISNYLSKSVKNCENIDYKKSILSILTGFLFVFYEIFDLQYALVNDSNCDFFVIAFNLISVDYFKICLMLLSFLLEFIK